MPRHLLRIAFLLTPAAAFLLACHGAQPASSAQQPILAPSGTPSPSPVPSPELTAAPPTAAGPSLPATIDLDPAEWTGWPVRPAASMTAYQIYQLGREMGRDERAFSVLGDCQSVPDLFLGLYDQNEEARAGLPEDLRETAARFQGSFGRLSATRSDAMVTSGMFSPLWHQGRYGCRADEGPLDCEIRTHNPSFAIIRLGTHYSAREEDYMRRILETLIDGGIVPILAFKADNSDYDGRTNALYARLAVEYGIPVWNLWAAVDGLPERGLYVKESSQMGKVYLTEDALAIQSRTGLEALDAVWRAVAQP